MRVCLGGGVTRSSHHAAQVEQLGSGPHVGVGDHLAGCVVGDGHRSAFKLFATLGHLTGAILRLDVPVCRMSRFRALGQGSPCCLRLLALLVVTTPWRPTAAQLSSRSLDDPLTPNWAGVQWRASSR